jgi:hypothetical protein
MIQHGYLDVEYLLFDHMYQAVYQQSYGPQYVRTAPQIITVITAPEIDLSHMARVLRTQEWSTYYWRESGISENVTSWNPLRSCVLNEGLIVGRYCSNLTAWLLANT